MTKREVVEAVVLDTERPKADVETIFDSLLEVIAGALRADERVDLRGFGSFVVKAKKARQGRNPRTGETITNCGQARRQFQSQLGIIQSVERGFSYHGSQLPRLAAASTHAVLCGPDSLACNF